MLAVLDEDSDDDNDEGPTQAGSSTMPPRPPRRAGHNTSAAGAGCASVPATAKAAARGAPRRRLNGDTAVDAIARRPSAAVRRVAPVRDVSDDEEEYAAPVPTLPARPRRRGV